MSELMDNPLLYKSVNKSKPEADKERLSVDSLLSSATIDDLIAAFLSGTPILKNISISVKDTKTSLTLEEGCIQLLIKTKNKITKITYAFNEADFDGGVTHTIEDGQYLKLSGLNLSGKTLYFSTSNDTRIIEIQQWKS